MFLIFTIFFSCRSTPEMDSPLQEVESPSEESQETPVTPPEIDSESLGDGEIYPQEESPYRNKKRMGVEQIKASMEQISGGIQWKASNQNLWDKYSPTLGVPDYQQSVTEDLSPSIMFQKFLDDAAIHTCQRWIENENDGEQRLFFSEIDPTDTDPSKVRLNIAYLRQRIHGQQLEPESPIVDSYVELHELVMQRTSDLASAWKTVCVGFFTHPDFYIY